MCATPTDFLRNPRGSQEGAACRTQGGARFRPFSKNYDVYIRMALFPCLELNYSGRLLRDLASIDSSLSVGHMKVVSMIVIMYTICVGGADASI